MSDPIPEIVPVDLEEARNGRMRIKRLPGGAHPLDVLGQVVHEIDEEYRAAHNNAPLVEWAFLKEAGEHGEPPHEVAILFSLEAGGQREELRRFIMVDNATGKPVPIATRLPNGEPSIAKADSFGHVGRILDFERIKAESAKRGLEIRASASYEVLETMKKHAEG